LLSAFYSLPVQLLINNLRKNQILLMLWAVPFLAVTQSWGRILGIPYLFLDPEYQNEVNASSLLIVGFFMGFFSMSYHITNYILDAQKFSFLGYLERPFGKFVINNSPISWAFLITFIVCFVKFQFKSGFQNNSQIFIEALSFMFSYIGVHILIYLYFRYTNKDIFKLFAHNIDQKLTQKKVNKVNVLRPLKVNPFKTKVRVDNYFDLYEFKFKRVNPEISYDKSYLLKVFDQNHLNAAMIQLISLVFVLVLSLLKNSPNFQFPASASIMILFSVLVTITGFISYWFRTWAITAGILLFFVVNFFVKLGFYDTTYKAYGLEYNKSKVTYNLAKLNELTSDQNYNQDVASTLVILENWKKKFASNTNKPKMIFLCASGGGQRAAVWALRTLSVSDSLTNGKLFDQSILMTGASGGMVGLSYYREMKLRQIQHQNKFDIDRSFYRLSRDVLNPVAFSLVVNDLFFKTRTFTFANQEYSQDRGYAFEKQLNENTENLMMKKLADYAMPEKEAIVPLLFLSPTIINDGRKLHISAQNVSYMSSVYNDHKLQLDNQRLKSIEFRRMFKDQNADSICFLSALRMSATFPYITPNVTLPSEPEMEIMDAGLADNFGFTDAVRFLYVFREWISDNTSGVVFISIRDSQKELEIEQNPKTSLLDKLFTPIGSLYESWDYLQDITNDNLVDYASGWFNNKIDVVDFVYAPRPKYWEKLQKMNIDHKQLENLYKEERASLSWHLTTREKESLHRSIYEPNNVKSINKLRKLLE
jgi:hypothetical protein